MRIERLGDLGSAPRVLRAIAAAAERRGMAPPAALIGEWFGYLSYPDAGADGRPPRIPEAAGGWTECVLRQDSDGHWWYESLSGAALPEWVEDALRNPLPASGFH